jgi:protein-disulfide isomerase
MRTLRSLSVLIFAICISWSLSAQQAAKPKPATKTPAAPAATQKTQNVDAALPTVATVDTFMKRMFGFNPAVTWKVVDISPSQISGVSRVLVTIGNQPQPTLFYVMPGGKFALVGDMIPFGADPFAPVRTKLNAEAHGPSRGAPAAPVTMVEFSDLQCPHCKAAQPVIDKLIAASPNAKLVFQSFPLPMHPWAMKAAEYADCVSQQNPDAFWKFINSIYDAQAEITEANADTKLTDLANAAGADGAKAAACSTRPEVSARVQKSIELGKEVGVSGTPTLFINGRKVQGITDTPFEQLKAMVDYDAGQAAKK